VASERAAGIKAALELELAPAQVSVADESAAHAGHAGAREGGHFRVRVVSERFRGHSQLERHRLVYKAVGELKTRGVHALAITALTPEEASG
jgi:BolA family transcriptional regulator, general stress-responsive regulator